MRNEVEFSSGGYNLRGWLELPDDATGPVPVAEGDQHGGTSDGEPRQHVDPVDPGRGHRDAISYARTRAELDPNRIAAWGTSLAGGVALVVGAVDTRVSAVISQVPMFAPEAFVERISPRPLPMTVADEDTLCPTDLAVAAHAAAGEPKSLHLVPGGHHSVYEDQYLPAITRQIEFPQTHPVEKRVPADVH